MRKSNICLTGVLEGRERENGAETVFEKIMVENFPELMTSQFSDSERPDKKFPQVTGILETQALVKPKIPSCGSSPFLTRCENTCGSWWSIFFFFYRGLFVFLFIYLVCFSSWERFDLVHKLREETSWK